MSVQSVSVSAKIPGTPVISQGEYKTSYSNEADQIDPAFFEAQTQNASKTKYFIDVKVIYKFKIISTLISFLVCYWF